ncbi:DUF7117 family protein [Halobaculum sp. D14]|uniref:DUF7117 family protein n=1 Tax=unclassified Halobaculum TaxID=2640896 RepID=UPI003EBBDD64
MEVRGERECTDCGARWSYFETGSVACPECGSMHSVGTGERKRHTDAPAELNLDPILSRLDDAPLADLTDDVKSACRAYLRKRGFIRGGDLLPLDDAYLVAAELVHAADVYARLGDRTDDEEWYVTALLRAADTGDRPAADEVPPRMREARGLAAAQATLEYRRDAATSLDDAGDADDDSGTGSAGDPDGEARTTLGALRDRAKQLEAVHGDVDPAVADALVEATRALGRYLVTGDDDSLDAARDRIDTV